MLKEINHQLWTYKKNNILNRIPLSYLSMHTIGNQKSPHHCTIFFSILYLSLPYLVILYPRGLVQLLWEKAIITTIRCSYGFCLVSISSFIFCMGKLTGTAQDCISSLLFCFFILSGNKDRIRTLWKSIGNHESSGIKQVHDIFQA